MRDTLPCTPMKVSQIRNRLKERVFPHDRAPSLTAISFLGALTGLLAGLAITGLHELIDLLRQLFANPVWRSADAVSPALNRFLITCSGAVLLGLLYQLSNRRSRPGGIVHIIERLGYHQGQLPLRNTLLQFFGTAIALGSGQVVGREGAAAHLGAASGSLLGQGWELPNTTLRTLVACGTAAGIAASFNTPLAGVIFTMEVIVMEYSVIGLAPVILAAVSANAVAHVWIDNHPTLIAESVNLASYFELPYLVLVGVIIGWFAGLFSRAVGQLTSALNGWPVTVAMAAAGVLTGALFASLPSLGADGFDTINRALAGALDWPQALMLAAAVMLCSGFAIASAIPGGVILPCMLSGACLGSALGDLGAIAAGHGTSDTGLYALLGLGAMIAAVLQAPLTALIVVLELSARTEVVFPAMLTVITAILVARSRTGDESIFARLLRNRGLDYRNDPVSQSLRRISVIAAMNRNFRAVSADLSLGQARELLTLRPDWFLVEGETNTASLIPAADLLRAVNAAEADGKAADYRLVLAKIPAERLQAVPIHLRASLQEAYDKLRESGVEALFAERATRHEKRVIYGVLTRNAIESSYRP